MDKTMVSFENSSNKILSSRSLEYLTLAGLGFCNEEIACILCVSSATVKKAFEVIYYKLRAFNRANAVLLACLYDIINDKVCKDTMRKYPDVKIMLNKKLLEVNNEKTQSSFKD